MPEESATKGMIAQAIKGTGTFLTARGYREAASAYEAGGESAARMREFEAKQIIAEAQKGRAVGGRRASQERKAGKELTGDLIARVVAGGGAVTDPSITKAIGDIGAESELRALTRMYEGEETGRGLEGLATARRMEAQVARQSAGIRARSAKRAGMASYLGLFSGKSLLNKYGETAISKV